MKPTQDPKYGISDEGDSGLARGRCTEPTHCYLLCYTETVY